MNEIKDIKIWKSKTETRIYVHTADGREGCRYLTGNPWHPAKSVDGNLTEEEWKQARKEAYYDGTWHTVLAPVETSSRRCPDCGGYDCGANCNSNNPNAPANQEWRANGAEY